MGAATYPRNSVLGLPTSPDAAGVPIAAVNTVLVAWRPNNEWSSQLAFHLCVRNVGLNPITSISMEQSDDPAGANPMITVDLVPLPINEERWYRLDPIPHYFQIECASALTSVADARRREVFGLR